MSGSELPAELVDRMVAVVRAIADVPKDSVLGQSGYASEARAIVALLPKHVDPDLAEVRRLASLHSVSLTEEGAKAIVEYFRGGRNA